MCHKVFFLHGIICHSLTHDASIVKTWSYVIHSIMLEHNFPQVSSRLNTTFKYNYYHTLNQLEGFVSFLFNIFLGTYFCWAVFSSCRTPTFAIVSAKNFNELAIVMRMVELCTSGTRLIQIVHSDRDRPSVAHFLLLTDRKAQTSSCVVVNTIHVEVHCSIVCLVSANVIGCISLESL